MRLPWILVICAAAMFSLNTRTAAAAVVSGFVLDSSDRPVENARIDHIGKPVIIPPTSLLLSPGPDEVRTKADGSFEVKTGSPVVVIRKPGYESQRIRVAEDVKLRITLRPIKPFPECPVKVLRIHTKNAGDVDFSGFWTYVKTKRGNKGIFAARGPTYTFGGPSDQDVRDSVEYFEVMYENGVVDARGRAADGTYWRRQSIFGAAAEYYRADHGTAEILDCIMDRNPLKP